MMLLLLAVCCVVAAYGDGHHHGDGHGHGGGHDHGGPHSDQGVRGAIDKLDKQFLYLLSSIAGECDYRNMFL